jgi:hypothetical protein
MAKLKKILLKDAYQVFVDKPVTIRNATLAALNLKAQQSFYDILNGTRPLNDAEKKEIANIFGLSVEAIRWPESKLLAE